MQGLEQRILQALTSFQIPIYYADVDDIDLESMHYFYYRETRLSRNGTGHLIQTYEIAYVSQGEDNLKEEDIIMAIEGKGFKFRDAYYERVKLESTNTMVDIVVFSFTKPLKRSGA